MVFNLEILSRLLSDPAAEVKLVDLAVFIPHGGLVVHDQLSAGVCIAISTLAVGSSGGAKSAASPF